jgi:BlaI family transcriptional regulator, penicillinase repressor
VARKKATTLTEAELRLMNVLWERGPSAVAEVVEALPEPLAYSTVLTTLRILEQKGYIEHTKEGRAFLYQPIVDQAGARRNAVRHLVDHFFNKSPELLVLNVLKQEEFDHQDLKRLKSLIEEGSQVE